MEPEDIPTEFIEILGDFIKEADDIQLCGDGEPLLSDAFWRALELASGRYGLPGRASIYSNGLLLNQGNIDRIISSELRHIDISLDAATPETYKKLRGADFDVVIRNIENLIATRVGLGAALPEVHVNMTLMMENIEELPKFIKLACRLGVDKTRFRHILDDANHRARDWIVERDDFIFDYREQVTSNNPGLANKMIKEALDTAKRLGVTVDTGFVERLYLPEGMESSPESLDESPNVSDYCECAEEKRGPVSDSTETVECEAPWRSLLIGIDGRVLPCCFMQQPVGSLKEGTPMEIWNGPQMQSLRRAIANHELHPICKGASCEYASAHQRGI